LVGRVFKTKFRRSQRGGLIATCRYEDNNVFVDHKWQEKIARLQGAEVEVEVIGENGRNAIFVIVAQSPAVKQSTEQHTVAVPPSENIAGTVIISRAVQSKGGAPMLELTAPDGRLAFPDSESEEKLKTLNWTDGTRFEWRFLRLNRRETTWVATLLAPVYEDVFPDVDALRDPDLLASAADCSADSTSRRGLAPGYMPGRVSRPTSRPQRTSTRKKVANEDATSRAYKNAADAYRAARKAEEEAWTGYRSALTSAFDRGEDRRVSRRDVLQAFWEDSHRWDGCLPDHPDSRVFGVDEESDGTGTDHPVGRTTLTAGEACTVGYASRSTRKPARTSSRAINRRREPSIAEKSWSRSGIRNRAISR
jgi:hypothetical protein